jgi:hypothetical protein
MTFYLDEEVNVPYLQKEIGIKKFFAGILMVTDETSRIRIRIRIWIRQSEAWIRGSGSTPKCHGSGTLLKTLSTSANL